MTATRTAVSVTGLRKSFGDKAVLDDIDLTVAEGTIFALLGPNGAGKTTMVHILSTLIGADGGEMSVAGHDLAAEPDAVRAAIGLTGQFSAVDNLLTGQENLILMADLRRPHLPQLTTPTCFPLDHLALRCAGDARVPAPGRSCGPGPGMRGGAPPAGVRAAPRPPLAGLALWGAVFVAACLWELWSLLEQPNLATSSYAHPTISTLTDPVLSTWAGRSIVQAAWLGLGWFLVER